MLLYEAFHDSVCLSIIQLQLTWHRPGASYYATTSSDCLDPFLHRFQVLAVELLGRHRRERFATLSSSQTGSTQTSFAAKTAWGWPLQDTGKGHTNSSRRPGSCPTRRSQGLERQATRLSECTLCSGRLECRDRRGYDAKKPRCCNKW